MSFYAMVVVVEAGDEKVARQILTLEHDGRVRDDFTVVGDPWEVSPSNDLGANLAAGKWIEGQEVDDYYPRTDPVFDADDIIGEKP